MAQPLVDIAEPGTAVPASRQSSSLRDEARGFASEARALDARIRRYTSYGRERDQRIREKLAHSRKVIKKPPLFRYAIVFSGALLLDILMVVLAFVDGSGAGVVPVLLVQVLIITPFWMMYTRVFLGRAAKDMRTQRAQLEEDVEAAQRAVRIMRTRYVRIARQASRSPAIRRASAAIATRTARLTGRSARLGRSLGHLGRFFRGPVARIGGNIVPWIKVVPWYVLGVIFTYKEHKREHEMSLELLETWGEAMGTLTEGENGLFAGQADLVAQGLQESYSTSSVPIAAVPDEVPRTALRARPSSTRDINPVPAVRPVPAT